MLDSPHPHDDEANVDREIRIEKMKRELFAIREDMLELMARLRER